MVLRRDTWLGKKTWINRFQGVFESLDSMINSQESLSSVPKKSPFFTSEKRPPLGLGSILSVLRESGPSIMLLLYFPKNI